MLYHNNHRLNWPSQDLRGTVLIPETQPFRSLHFLQREREREREWAILRERRESEREREIERAPEFSQSSRWPSVCRKQLSSQTAHQGLASPSKCLSSTTFQPQRGFHPTFSAIFCHQFNIFGTNGSHSRVVWFKFVKDYGSCSHFTSSCPWTNPTLTYNGRLRPWSPDSSPFTTDTLGAWKPQGAMLLSRLSQHAFHLPTVKTLPKHNWALPTSLTAYFTDCLLRTDLVVDQFTLG